MKTVVICGPQASSGVERCADLVRDNGGTPIIVPTLSGFEVIPSADVHIIFRKQAMDLSGYVIKSNTQIGIIYANSQAAGTLVAGDLEKIPGADSLYLSPVETVSGWIRKTLSGGADEDDFSWDFGSEVPSSPEKPKRRIRIACYSPLGGVGKTTASVMIGKLAQDSGQSVCIIESDNDNAGVLQALGSQPVSDGLGCFLEEEWEQADVFENRIKECLQTAHGISVVPIGSDTLGMKCDQNNIGNLYEWANRQPYSVVIYDLPPQLSELSVYKTLQEVDIIILIGEPTTKAEEKLIRFVTRAQGLQGLKDIESKLRLLINKYISNAGITDAEIAETVGIPLIGTIPVDPEGYYKMINNRKITILKDSPWHDVWGALSPYVEDPSIVTKPVKTKVAKGGFWKKLLGIK